MASGAKESRLFACSLCSLFDSDLRNIHRRDLVAVTGLAGSEDRPAGVGAGEAEDGVLHSAAADLPAVAVLPLGAAGGVEDHIHHAGLDHVLNVGMGVAQTLHQLDLDIPLGQVGMGAAGGIELHTKLHHLLCQLRNLFLILILDGEDDLAALSRHLHTGALEGLQQRLGEGLGKAQALAGGLHLRAKVGVHVSQLLEGEHGHLDGIILGLGVDVHAVAQVTQLLTQHDLGGKVNDGHARDLGDVRDGTGGAGVGLNDVDLVVIDDELNVIFTRLRVRVGAKGKIIVIADACHSGSGSRGQLDDEIIVRGTGDKFILPRQTSNIIKKPEPTEWLFVAACKPYQSNYEYRTPEGDYYGVLSYIIANEQKQLDICKYSELLREWSKSVSEKSRYPQDLDADGQPCRRSSFMF